MPSLWSSLANASAKRSRSMPWPVAMSVSAAALHGGLAVAHRQRALARRAPGQLHRLGHELVLGEDGLDEPDAQRLVGADVAAAEHEVLGPALARRCAAGAACRRSRA